MWYVRDTFFFFYSRFGLTSLVKLSQSHDSETRYAAALCLRKLSPNLGSHLSLVRSGALRALMNLVNPKHRKPKNNPWFTPMATAGYRDPKKKPKNLYNMSSSTDKSSITSAAAMVAVVSTPSKEECDRLINGAESSDEESDEEEVLNGRSAITVRSHALAALRDLSDNPDVLKQFVEEVCAETRNILLFYFCYATQNAHVCRFLFASSCNTCQDS